LPLTDGCIVHADYVGEDLQVLVDQIVTHHQLQFLLNQPQAHDSPVRVCIGPRFEGAHEHVGIGNNRDAILVRHHGTAFLLGFPGTSVMSNHVLAFLDPAGGTPRRCRGLFQQFLVGELPNEVSQDIPG
jgi:hypothetical protein